MSPQEIKKEYLGMAGAFNIPIGEATLLWFYRSVDDLDPAKVVQAMRKYGRETKVQRLPTPAIIREMVEQKPNLEQEAIESSARLIQSLGKFGYMRGEEARVFMGELAWRCVERLGGWGSLCRRVGDSMDQGTFLAQVRELAKTTIARGIAGLDDTPPQLPENVRSIFKLPIKTME
jgi:hypothetical protein